jgi:hypothetical protein
MNLQKKEAQQKLSDCLMIARLKKLSCWPEIVRKIALGESARSVAGWCHSLKLDRPNWTYLTWCRAIETVYRELKRQLKLPPSYKARIQPLRPERLAQIAEAVEQTSAQMVVYADDLIPEGARAGWRVVRSQLQEITAEVAAKWGFVQCMKLIGILMGQIEQTPMLALSNPQILKALEVLVKYCEAMRQQEQGKAYLQGKVSFGGPLAGAYADLPPNVDVPPDFAALDEVDQNLVREAIMRTIDLVKEETSGRFDARGGSGIEPGAETAAKA